MVISNAAIMECSAYTSLQSLRSFSRRRALEDRLVFFSARRPVLDKQGEPDRRILNDQRAFVISCFSTGSQLSALLLSLSHELLNFFIELAAELEPRERDEPGCDVLPRWNQRLPGESDLERDQRLSIPPSFLG